MTNRERILTILDGGAADRLPWIPRLRIWYDGNLRAGTLPAKFRGLDFREIERRVFGGTAARDGIIFRSRLEGVEVRTRQIGDHDSADVLTEYVTPAGRLTERRRATQRMRQLGIVEAQTEFMLKRRQDYAAAECLIEHTRYEPAYDEYLSYEADVGEDGYPLVNCGDCPFHYWMQALAGYNQAYYHLNDFPNVVERFVAVLTDCWKQTIWRHMLDSPARLLLHGHHLSSQMTPPPLFDQYITPYFQELTPQLRSAGKIVAMHADNDTRQILGRIERAGFGMVECFVTAPMVDTTLEEARAAWGDRVIIWGGVPSVILEDPYTDEQFESFMNRLFDTVGSGRAFILGIADNAMPGSRIERIERITQLVQVRR